jgi:hypothetical protein
MMFQRFPSTMLLCLFAFWPAAASWSQVLDKQQMLDAQTFWDNRDWDWYGAQIPFFECPDADITTTYYYRWELLTKHLTYGSPNTGYTFTEFIDRPFWSGAYGAISCPAGHQLYEARWLREPQIAQDFARYWFRTPGAQPRNYSTWLADSVWATALVHGDQEFAQDLLTDLVANYEGWEERHFVPEVGLFWQTGHDDGMEFNINSRQTQDILRGAPSYRPSFNSYMWADAVAIARIAEQSGDTVTAKRFERKAAALKTNMQAKLWDAKREFFFPMFKNDETAGGFTVKAGTLTYQSGKFAGSKHGRELIGYVPWQFNLPDPNPEFEKSWKFLMSPEYFAAPFGPTTVERNDPQFLLQKSCCWWSGQSWPYATTQTLKAMANLLQNYTSAAISKEDYLHMLRTYAISHRKDGKPYLAEALHPETGSFEGHDAYNHSEHYFHSGFCDLIITGLVGLQPRSDRIVEVKPLAPSDWDYFALDDLVYQGHALSIVWDKSGDRYHFGPGLHVIVDGDRVVSSPELGPLQVALPADDSATVDTKAIASADALTKVNFAVNNDGDYFPQITTSHTGGNSSPMKLIDGNYWYHLHPPNRWTAGGSTQSSDWIELDFGKSRRLHMLKLYFLQDDRDILPPQSYVVEHWSHDAWHPLPDEVRTPASPTGRRANVVQFAETEVSKLRIVLQHTPGSASGLTEIEAWGWSSLPVVPAPAPAGNLAFNSGQQEYPRVAASHTSRFDKLQFVNDGRIVYSPTPNNRWTTYESQSTSDWVEIDFGAIQSVGRIVLHIYDDRGGVQAPESFHVEALIDGEWTVIPNCEKVPAQPVGGMANTVRFAPTATQKIRVVFKHRNASRSGLTEMEVWEK